LNQVDHRFQLDCHHRLRRYASAIAFVDTSASRSRLDFVFLCFSNEPLPATSWIQTATLNRPTSKCLSHPAFDPCNPVDNSRSFGSKQHSATGCRFLGCAGAAESLIDRRSIVRIPLKPMNPRPPVSNVWILVSPHLAMAAAPFDMPASNRLSAVRTPRKPLYPSESSRNDPKSLPRNHLR